jgi:hypothetical protein
MPCKSRSQFTTRDQCPSTTHNRSVVAAVRRDSLQTFNRSGLHEIQPSPVRCLAGCAGIQTDVDNVAKPPP